MEVSGQLHGPAALPPGIELRYSFYRRLVGPQNRYVHCEEEKISSLPGNGTPDVQTVARRYTD
jgi:hypothetical protein